MVCLGGKGEARWFVWVSRGAAAPRGPCWHLLLSFCKGKCRKCDSIFHIYKGWLAAAALQPGFKTSALRTQWKKLHHFYV